MRLKTSYLLLAGFLSACPLALHAQTAAKIIGSVKDQDGKPVPFAIVDSTGQRSTLKKKLKAEADGSFILPEMPPDVYQVSATCDTCNDVSSLVEVGAGQTRTVELRVNTKSTSTEISVDKSATTIETNSARLGFNATAPEIAGLPVNGRTFGPLALTAPLVGNSGGADIADLRFAGQSNQQNHYRLDGVDASAVSSAAPSLVPVAGAQFRLRSSVETLQEFRVDSAMYTAEDGFGTGGQIKLVSRSAGNDWHASLYEYFRNNKLDARNFFDGAAKTDLRMNQFGFNGGGRLKKDKLFIYGGMEQLRQRAGLNVLESVPSAGIRATAVESILPLVNLIPAGTAPTNDQDVSIASRQALARQQESNWNFRADYLLNTKQRFFLRYSRNNGTLTNPDETTTVRDIAAVTHADNAATSWTAELTPAILNQLTLGWNRTPTSIDVHNTSSAAAASRAILGSTSGATSPGPLVRLLTGDYGSAASFRGRSYSLIDSVDWLHGAHSIKLGGEYRVQRMPFSTAGGSVYRYLNLEGFLANVDADVTYRQDLPSRTAAQERYSAFVQDEWRAKSNLTVNVGLRYEYYGATREANNNAKIFDLATFSYRPANGGFYQPSRLGFQPRLAVAWSPKKAEGRTVIRAGIGIYQGPMALLDTIQPIQNGASRLFLRGSNYPQTAASLLASGETVSTPYAFEAGSYRHTQRNVVFSSSIQRALAGQFVAQIAYTGILSRHLTQQGATNLGTGIDSESGHVTRPAEDLSAIPFLANRGSSNYHALQLGLSRRLIDNFTMSASYNLAHSIGNTTGAGESQAMQNPNCLACERADNSFDIRNSFSLIGTYALPSGRYHGLLRSNLVGKILDGWSIAGAFNARTGLPVNVQIDRPDEIYFDPAAKLYYSPHADRPENAYAVANVPGGGEDRGVMRPNLVPGVNPYSTAKSGAWLNPAAFAIPSVGTFGNLGRNALRGPGFQQLDFQVSRSLAIRERAKLQIRAEAYNILNHTNFANPSSQLVDALLDIQPGAAYSRDLSPGFGAFKSTIGRTVGLGTSRKLQLSLRLDF